MAEFLYRAVDRTQKVTDGQISASSTEAALRQLREQGLTPIAVTPAEEGGRRLLDRPSGGRAFSLRRHRGKPGPNEVLQATKELSVLLRAGLPLDRSLKVMIGMTAQPVMGAILQNILDAVKNGRGLSTALRNHADLFGELYINIVRSGEASGQLAEVLMHLEGHLERSKALRQSVISALIYPAILLVVATLSVMLMLGFVVPQFKPLFADMGETLPMATRIVIATGDWISTNGWILLLLIILIGFGWQRWKATPSGRTTVDRMSLRLPLIGPTLLKYEITRFARTLGTLLGNGVSVLESLKIAIDTVGNASLREALAGLPPAIKQGGRLAAELDRTGLFNQAAIQMVTIGEESGRLDAMLLQLANVYDDEVQTGIKRALILLEPLLILSLGAIIAAIIISILMGILSVNELVA